MSTFRVEKTKISKIYAHGNADKMELAQVEGMTFQFCVKKDEFKVGDAVVYFPIDSVMTEELVGFFGIGNFLAGGKRVKTVKLRGEISQGFVAAIESIVTFLEKQWGSTNGSPMGVSPDTQDFTSLLGITKYEPPVTMQNNARLIPLDCSPYDLEGADRYPHIVEELLKEDLVFIHEKIEGMNMAVTYLPDGTHKVAQRNFYIQSQDPENPHSFEKLALERVIPALTEFARDPAWTGKQIRFRGEFTGPGSQGNYYGLKDQVALGFEMDVDGKPMDARDLDYLVAFNPIISSGLDHVPLVFKGKLTDFLAGRTIQEASNGQSLLNPKLLREGIVIRPSRERDVPGFGRLILKQRSPQYLAKTDY